MVSTQLLSEEDNSWLVINPYGNRGPVTKPAQFYGRRNDVLSVAQSIMLWQPFAVSGEPRIGKTSLLYYLVHPEGARNLPEFQKYIGDPSHYLFVLVELQRLPVKNAVGFWRYLLDRLIDEARKDDSTNLTEQKAFSITQGAGTDQYQVQTSFETCLKQLRKKVVFLFDDFHILIEDFDDIEVVQVTDTLRTLKEALDLNNWLNYIIVSTDPLVRLFKKKPIFSVSPFISIVVPIPPLGLLERDATNELIHEPLRHSVEQRVPPFTEQDIAFIYELAGRYPDFIKITCYNLFAAYSQGNMDFSTVRQKIADDPYVRWLMEGLWERLKQDEQLEKLPLQEVVRQIAQGQPPTNMAAFRELCQRGLVEGVPSSPRVFGDLFCTFILNQEQQKLDQSSPIVTLPIELTHKEALLYRYLAEHLGQACSRTQLQSAIWGDKIPGSPDALEQLVKRVRIKIEPNRDQPLYLISVRGQGYLLRSEPTKPLP